MKEDMMIIGKDQYYSLNTRETRLNNNVLVVGASGTGKTRSIVIPNILQATGSYVISDPKGNLYGKYGDYLRERGYKVRKLDFTDPLNSGHYNLFRYIRNTQDIVKIAHMLIYQQGMNSHVDPFWDQASQLLVQACIAYLIEGCQDEEKTFCNLMKVIGTAGCEGDLTVMKSPLDRIMAEHEKHYADSYAVKTYEKYRVAADKTLRSIQISINARLGLFDTPELAEMMGDDDIDIPSIGREKTALFVVISDTDRSMDCLANVFFTQAMNELCLFADKECEDNRLPVPVRFIMDDFATNCRINDLPRMIASIRSRDISLMLMIQAESQLTEGYGEDGRTIIGNCDTYVYLGGNDVETARSVAERCDLPMKKILNMPVETIWIFRRGQNPINGVNFDLEPFLREKKGRCKDGHDTYERG